MSGAPGDWSARLRLDPTAYVAPGAVVTGVVTLAPKSSVWFNAVVRGDSAPISLGEASNLQDLCVVHVDEGMPAVIGARVTVGHRAVVHGCVIEDECLIGMGSILLSGARIGAGSLIGAGALVREKQVVPPDSLVLGMPGKVVGVAAQRAGIRGSSDTTRRSPSYLGAGSRASAAGAAGITDATADRSRSGWAAMRCWRVRLGGGRLDRHGAPPGRPPEPGRWSRWCSPLPTPTPGAGPRLGACCTSVRIPWT
jgi:carbonic anhydrase/acetyltransferase-like protein (isoleucine patch superfamily)